MAKNLKARYRVVGPKREKVEYTLCSIDDATGSLQQKKMEEEMECYYVFFPRGHSIRVTSKEKLVELGYHIKPRVVDMDTGDIIDIGGDLYDFGDGSATNENIVLSDDIDDPKPAKRRTADANA